MEPGLSQVALAVKNLAGSQCRRHWDADSIPESGRSPGGGHGKSTPVFLSGESHGQKNLAGYSPWGCKESDMTGRLSSRSSILEPET